MFSSNLVSRFHLIISLRRRGPWERGCVGSDLKFIMLLLELNCVTGGLEPQIKKKDYELNGLYLYENDGHQKFVTLIIKCR